MLTSDLRYGTRWEWRTLKIRKEKYRHNFAYNSLTVKFVKYRISYFNSSFYRLCSILDSSSNKLDFRFE